MVVSGHILGSGGRLDNCSWSGAGGPFCPGAAQASRRRRQPAYLTERTALFLGHPPRHRLDEFGSAESTRYTLKGEGRGKKRNSNPVPLEGNVFPAASSLKF